MKNRKKLLVLLMCTCMLLGTTACGNRRDTQNDTTMNDATDKTKDNNDKTDRNENRTDDNSNGKADNVVDDVTDGVNDVVDGLTRGATDAVDDAADGMTKDHNAQNRENNK
jgi:hypothetical protein